VFKKTLCCVLAFALTLSLCAAWAVSAEGSITPGVTSLTIEKGSSAKVNLTVSIGRPRNLATSSTDRNIAFGMWDGATWNGDIIPLTIAAKEVGEADIRIRAKDNPEIYCIIKVKVTAPADGEEAAAEQEKADEHGEYYAAVKERPLKALASDLILDMSDGNKANDRFMLVPKDYDVARANTEYSKAVGSWLHYIVYAESPPRKNSEVTARFNMRVDGKYVGRFIITPRNPDEPTFDTAKAEYTKEWRYYTIYNSPPAKNRGSDLIRNWRIRKDGKVIERYLLVPSSDRLRSVDIIEADQAGHHNFLYYTVYDDFPQHDPGTSNYDSWFDNDKYRVILYPKRNVDYVRLNEAILVDTRTFRYFQVYSIMPTARFEGEQVLTYTENQLLGFAYRTNVTYYVLVNTNDPEANKKLTNAINGKITPFREQTPQGKNHDGSDKKPID